jgi:hypothetical protein
VVPGELATLQRRFYELIAQPDPVGEAAARRAAQDPEGYPLERWIDAGGERERAASRLGVYARMHFTRLHASMLEDFPAVAHVIGGDAFRHLVARYVVAHPPRATTLRGVGAAFADFLASDRVGMDLRELVDLARLERARLEVFDAPEETPLRFEDLAAVTPDDWPALNVQTVVASQRVRVGHAVEQAWSAEDEGRQAPDPTPHPGVLLVWRRGFIVRHRRLDEREAVALEACARGASLQVICEALAERLSEEDAPSAVRATLTQWLVDELLVSGGTGTPAPTP